MPQIFPTISRQKVSLFCREQFLVYLPPKKNTFPNIPNVPFSSNHIIYSKITILNVFPPKQLSDLEEEDAGRDERGEDRPAGDEEVARVVADHIPDGLTESPKLMCKETPFF